MKVHARTLSNIAYTAASNAIDNSIGRCCGELKDCPAYEFQAFDEAAWAIEIKRQLAAGKRRIVLDIDYREG